MPVGLFLCRSSSNSQQVDSLDYHRFGIFAGGGISSLSPTAESELFMAAVVVGLLFGVHRRRSIVSYSNSFETGFLILPHTPVNCTSQDLHFDSVQ